MAGLDALREQYHHAQDDFIQGNPEPMKRLWSRREDVTLANPLGPPARGWDAVRQVMERASAQLADGTGYSAEIISMVATTDLAYDVAIERCSVKVGGSDVAAPVSLRVTTVFRNEGEGWTIVHRHADPITGDRPIASITHST
jgi:ketosteroid isomerase-like protein